MKTSNILKVLALISVSSYSLADWSSHTTTDEMTGEIKSYAMSEYTGTKSKLGFPYQNLKALLSIGCDNNSEWIYVAFSSQPIISGDTQENGYSTFSTRIKWDDEILNYAFLQTSGSDAIHFDASDFGKKAIIEKIGSHNNALLELNWYGEGKIYFNFDLSGSSKAISEIRQACVG